jgi:hypothetical protein
MVLSRTSSCPRKNTRVVVVDLLLCATPSRLMQRTQLHMSTIKCCGDVRCAVSLPGMDAGKAHRVLLAAEVDVAVVVAVEVVAMVGVLLTTAAVDAMVALPPHTEVVATVDLLPLLVGMEIGMAAAAVVAMAEVMAAVVVVTTGIVQVVVVVVTPQVTGPLTMEVHGMAALLLQVAMEVVTEVLLPLLLVAMGIGMAGMAVVELVEQVVVVDMTEAQEEATSVPMEGMAVAMVVLVVVEAMSVVRMIVIVEPMIVAMVVAEDVIAAAAVTVQTVIAYNNNEREREKGGVLGGVLQTLLFFNCSTNMRA